MFTVSYQLKPYSCMVLDRPSNNGTCHNLNPQFPELACMMSYKSFLLLNHTEYVVTISKDIIMNFQRNTFYKPNSKRPKIFELTH